MVKTPEGNELQNPGAGISLGQKEGENSCETKQMQGGWLPVCVCREAVFLRAALQCLGELLGKTTHEGNMIKRVKNMTMKRI